MASVAATDRLVGRRLGGRIAGGEPVTTTRLVARTASEGLPAGTVAAHVLVADERVLDLVAVGHRVTLFAEVGGSALAQDVLVLGIDTPESAFGAGPFPSGDAVARGLVCALTEADVDRVFAGHRPEGGAPRVLPVLTG